MNASPNLPPDDPERLLRSGLRDTTPAFEQRWTDLKRRLRTEPVARSPEMRARWWWAFVPIAVTMAMILFVLRPQSPPAPRLPPDKAAAYGQLFDLDDALRDALPLADATTLETLLLIAAQTGGQS